MFQKFNGKYLKVDNNPVVLEGEWDYSRLILIEFPDKDSGKIFAGYADMTFFNQKDRYGTK